MVGLKQRLEIVAIFLGVLWAVYFLDLLPYTNFTTFGIMPRTISGLKGIIFAPFIHASIFHLLFNSISLGMALFLTLIYKEEKIFIVIGIIAVVSGLGTWLFGSPGYHIGASGIFYGLVGYLVSVGWCEKNIWAITLSVFCGVFYAGTILFMLIPIPGMSMSGHFFGLVGGFAAAKLTSMNCTSVK